MGAGASTQAAPFKTVEAALAAGKTQEEVDKWQTDNAGETKTADAEANPAATEEKPAAAAAAETPAATADAAVEPAVAVEAAAADATAAEPAAEAVAEAPKAAEASADGVDRSEIERNKNGSEEPSSADPELWNIDNCEVDILVKYKMGGQMWYVQSRMRENTAKSPAAPIPGFPMNKKAEDAKRFYAKEDEGEFNKGSENFANAKGWKEIEAANPPVAA
jgi:hypothetical protein